MEKLTKTVRSEQRRLQEQAGFDVVCTIGSVMPGVDGVSPLEAAMVLVARHGAPGQFSWPGVTLTLEFDGELTEPDWSQSV